MVELLAVQPYTQQAQLFKLLMHPARLAILDILRDGEHCVCHIKAHLGYRQAYISQQIAVLRQAGLIIDHREGWNIYYHVVDPGLFAVLDTVNTLLGEAPTPVKKNVQKPCPCPHCSAMLESKA